MEKIFAAGGVVGRRRSGRVKPTAIYGRPGYSIYGGRILYNETSRRLQDRATRWRIYESIIANTSIVGAGVRLFTDLVKGARWTLERSKDDTAHEYVDMATSCLMEHPKTTWPHAIARIAMFRYFGFSLQEWVMKMHEDGYYTYRDIQLRPPYTIYGWNVNDQGDITEVFQQDPQDQDIKSIPIAKTVYLVDDEFTPSPEGLGLLRQMVEPCQRMERFEMLQGYGFDLDLRGMPIVRSPRQALMSQPQPGIGPDSKDEAPLSLEEVQLLEADILDLVNNPVFDPERGVVLDSYPYYSSDGGSDTTVSDKPWWDLELLRGDARAHGDIRDAIAELRRDIARLQLCEHMLLGDGAGSYSLSKDKTDQYRLMLDGVLELVRVAGIQRSLLESLWMVNGWDERLMPEVIVSPITHRDIVEMSETVRNLATGGVEFYGFDPIVRDILHEAGSMHRDEVEDDDLIPEDEEIRQMREGVEEDDEEREWESV